MSPVRVFRPSKEEFSDFKRYINYMESQGAAKDGIAKVIPPEDFNPRKNGYDDIFSTTIEKPIRQEVQGLDGVFEQFTHPEGSMTVDAYRAVANSCVYKTPKHNNYNELENIFWSTIDNNVIPLYGADNVGSAMDLDAPAWNMNKLGTILDTIIERGGQLVNGVNSSYLYYGMWKTFFVWHTEDMDLYSVNYLHVGEPKTWYSIPTDYAREFEKLLADLFVIDAANCKAFYRHKVCVVSPKVLKYNNIPCNKITQERGEFIVTFPMGYHSGFNHGFNLAEAINFASERWIEFGKRVTQCICMNNNVVQFSMDVFVKTFQPALYETWKKGLDIGPHPEFPEDIGAANKPTVYGDLWCNKNNQKRMKKINKPKKGRRRRQKQKSKNAKIAEKDSLQDSNKGDKNVERVDEIAQDIQEEPFESIIPSSSAFQSVETTISDSN